MYVYIYPLPTLEVDRKVVFTPFLAREERKLTVPLLPLLLLAWSYLGHEGVGNDFPMATSL